MFVVHDTVKLRAGDINPAAYNPRKVSPEKFEALKRNIMLEGFVEPLVVQKNGLCLIGGHQRLKAVKEISVEHGEAPPDLPCVVLDVDDKRAKRLNIKLNSLTGEFEARMLGELLIDIYEEPDVPEEEAFDLGFTREEAMDYVHLIEPPPETGGDDKAGGTEFARSVTLSIEFSTVDARNRVKKLLAERSTIEKKKPGDIVAAFFAPRARKPKAKRPSKKRAA